MGADRLSKREQESNGRKPNERMQGRGASDKERLENNVISEQLQVEARRDGGSENVRAKEARDGREKLRSWKLS